MNPAPNLRPMTIVQILDASFRLYRENFLLFIGIMAAALAPVMVADIASTGLMSERLPELALNLVIMFIAVPLGRGALTRAVSDRYLGEPATFGKSYRALLPILVPYLGTTLLVGLVWGVGAALCLVPFLFLFPLYAFVPMVMVLEGKTSHDAMNRSKELSAGHRWRILGLGALELGLNLALGLSFNLLLDFVLPLVIDSPWTIAVVAMGASYALYLVLEPLWTLAFILLYYDVRIRKEAFDLHVLAERSAA